MVHARCGCWCRAAVGRRVDARRATRALVVMLRSPSRVVILLSFQSHVTTCVRVCVSPDSEWNGASSRGRATETVNATVCVIDSDAPQRAQLSRKPSLHSRPPARASDTNTPPIDLTRAAGSTRASGNRKTRHVDQTRRARARAPRNASARIRLGDHLGPTRSATSSSRF